MRCDLAAAAATDADPCVIEDQLNSTNPAEYDWLFGQRAEAALRGQPPDPPYSEVSANCSTPDQMAAAAQSVPAGGYYVSITTTTAISPASLFFQKMQAADH